MPIETRPSAVFWIFQLLIVLIVAAIAWVPILLVVAQFVEPDNRLVASLIGTLIVPLLLAPKALESIRSACWQVDFEGLESPVIGRIRFADVASVYRGYPRKETLAMTGFQTVIAPGSREIIEEALVLRLADGRLVVLNFLSPTIHRGLAAMSKIQELLEGKPLVGYSAAEVEALKARPMNRIVVPKNA